MPQHTHKTTLAARLSVPERVLVAWLVEELNDIRTALGMPEISPEHFEQVGRDLRAKQRLDAQAEGR